MAHKERHTASKKKGGAVKILLAVVLLLVLAAGAAGVFAYNEIHGSGKPGTEASPRAAAWPPLQIGSRRPG